jgi:hypothetical protein
MERPVRSEKAVVIKPAAQNKNKEKTGSIEFYQFYTNRPVTYLHVFGRKSIKSHIRKRLLRISISNHVSLKHSTDNDLLPT